MNEQERLDYAKKELEAIYEDLEANIQEQLLIKDFLGNLLVVLKDSEPSCNLVR